MARSGQEWKPNEDKYILDSRKAGVEWDVINAKCKRTVKELQERYETLSWDYEPAPKTAVLMDSPPSTRTDVSGIDMSAMVSNAAPSTPAPTTPAAAVAKPTARRGAAWTIEEELQLKKELQEGKDDFQIASLHSRTATAIKMHIDGNVKKLKGQSVPQISQSTGVSQERVKAILVANGIIDGQKEIPEKVIEVTQVGATSTVQAENSDRDKKAKDKTDQLSELTKQLARIADSLEAINQKLSK